MTGLAAKIGSIGLAAGIVACGAEGGRIEDESVRNQATPQVVEGADTVVSSYEPIHVVDGGSIQGTIRFAGVRPGARVIDVPAEAADCGATQVVQTVAIGPRGGLADVVISLVDIRQGAPLDAGLEPVLDQRGCRFVPHVLLAPVGASVRVLNSDPLTHNVHTAAFENRSVNRSQPAGLEAIELTFDAAEKVKVKCDLHPWMSAWIVVTDHPYHAVTNEAGRFDLSNIPPGDYIVETWHEAVGSSQRPVTIHAGETLNLAIDLAAAE